MTTDPTALEQRSPPARRDNQDPALFGQTPSQTVGPFFHYGLPWKGGADLAGKSDLGTRPELFGEAHYILNLSAPTGTPAGDIIEVTGTVTDVEGQPVPDAMIEIWQANAAGRYRSARDTRADVPLDQHFVGFGRAATAEDGGYRFRTIRPGPVPGPAGAPQAAHLAIALFGRGLLKRLATRLYFAGDPALQDDPVLCLVPPARRHTLIAAGGPAGTWRLDLRLGGADETVFFDL